MPKTKIIRKNAYVRLLEVKGERTGQVSAGSPQKRVLLLYFDSFSLPNAKISKIKAFLKVSLVSLTFRLRTVF